MTEIFDLDLDEELLSHLAIPESVSELWSERIGSEHIEDPFVQEVFQWQFNHLREHSKIATASVLADQFDLDFVEPLTAIGDLIDRLRLRYMRNNGRKKMEVISTAYKEDPAALPKVIVRVGRELGELVNKRGEYYGTGDFPRAIQRYNELVLKGPGPSLGFKEVDEHFHGLRGITFGLAPPKSWKSWVYGANIVVENVKLGRNVDLYSLELPAEESYMRIQCLTAGVPYWKYLRGSLSQQDQKLLEEASDLLDSMGIYRCIKPPPGHRTMAEMIEQSRDSGADLVVMDQLQYVETDSGLPLGGAKPQEYWQPLNIARDLSDEIPLVIIHQFNRSVMNADKMPEMQQAKGAAAIEETATLALGMWANKDMRRSNTIEL
jgi:hypothetical protein